MNRYLLAATLLATQAFCVELNPDGYFRAMYLGDKDSTAAAFGGMVAVAPTFGGINSRVAFYTVLPSAVRADSQAKLFSDNTSGYSLLGEASLGYKNESLSVVAGRQKVVTPLVDMDDGRIVPNLFEGVSAKYTLGGTVFEAYYLTRMSGFWSQIFSGRDMSRYVSMSEAAGYGSITPNSPLVSLGLTHTIGEQRFSGWVYHVADLMSIAFGEYQTTIALNKDTKLQFAVQAAKQSANGKLSDSLSATGKNLDQEYVGLKVGATHKELSGYLATTLVSDSKGRLDKNMMNVWAGIPQYTVVNEHVMKSFDTDGAKMYKAQLGYKFTQNTDGTASYLYVDGLASKGVKDESVTELVLSTKFSGFTLNGVLLLHDASTTYRTIAKSTLEYRF